MKKHFVIIGGDAAGMSAASKARRENLDLLIDVFEKSQWASYGACGMPYFIKGDINRIEDLIARTPEEFKKNRINLHLEHEVTRINPREKYITVRNPLKEICVPYDNLLISTGAHPGRPNIKGLDNEHVFTLHDMESAGKIKNYLKENTPKSAVIMGGGYIGIEMLEAFYSWGMEIHLVELLPHILSPFGIDTAVKVEEYLSRFAVLHLGQGVRGIDKIMGGKLSVELDYENISTDMVLVATGVVPEVALAKDAGIKIGITGAITADEFGRTNFSSIYVAGDCAEVQNIVTGHPDYIPLALSANRNGRCIGTTVAKKPTYLTGVTGTAVLKAFKLEIARTGITDLAVARKYGFDPVSVKVESHSRASYYPGSKPIQITLLADRSSKRILGASMVGEEGVSKRIDIISTALFGFFTANQLENLDLSYAPPFGPAWDPVLIAARILKNKLTE